MFRLGKRAREFLPVLAVLVAGVAVSAIILAWWRNTGDTALISRRLPVPGEVSSSTQTSPGEVIKIGEKFASFAGIPSLLPGAWPCFRGARHDNIAPPEEKLASSWPPGGPPVLWTVDLGEGYAGPAILNGRVYLLDYDAKENADALRCFSLDDGREIWRRWYKVHIKRNHGISRTVPAVSENYVVTIGPRCHVMCVDAKTGEFRWGLDLEKDWGTTVPMWYTGQCPLITDNQAIIAVGGKVLLMGVDCDTGKILWQTPNPNNWQMSHACVTPMEWQGKKMYVYAAIGGIIGISAEKGEEGKVLWQTDEWKFQVVAPSPVPLEDGRFLMTAGYGAGSALFRLTQATGSITAKLESRIEKTNFACEQHTPLYYQGNLFSVLPADAGGFRKQAVCMDPVGKIMWRSGATEQFGLGPFMIADNKLLILEDNGMLTMLEASARSYVKLAQAKVLDGKEAWAPMALAGGRLLVRDYGQMKCLDLKDCQYDLAAIKKTDTNLLIRSHVQWIKPSLSNLTALAVDRADRIIVGSMSAIEILSAQGTPITSISLSEPVRCLATSTQGDIFVGLNNHVEVFDQTGTRKAVWKRPDPKSMLTSIAVSSTHVFVADCANRIVWRFTLAGETAGQIGQKDQDQRKEGFVVPSAFFDLAVAADESLWVVNPGLHRLEHFSVEGAFLGCWGNFSMEAPGFCGCCNPSNMALTSEGEFITSEKHIVRVKQYDTKGQLKGVISDQEDWPDKAVGLDLAVDSKGRILVLDPTADVIRVYAKK
ncbi:MAG: PQQ-binding-like beta-propeller repeat protein [bacterium]